MILKRVKKLKNVGIFRDFVWPNPNSFPDLKTYNVIYGWNGTGKSTISRLLRSLEKDEVVPSEYKEGKFELIFADKDGNATTINNNNIEDAPNVRVFNEEFVKKHIQWDNIQAEAIAYLGEENVERKKELDRLKNKLSNLSDQQISERAKRDKIKDEVTEWKKNHAKLIKEALTTEGRKDQYANYNLSNIRKRLNTTFKERHKDYSELIKTDEELLQIKNAIHQSRKDKLPTVVSRLTSLNDLLREVKNILVQTAVSKTIEELKNNPKIERWVRSGFHIHQSNDLGICQFCNQNLRQGRITRLEEHFNESYENLVKNLDSIKKNITTAAISFEAPNKLEVDSSLRIDYNKLLIELEKKEEEWEENKNKLLEIIQQKEKSVHKSLDLDIKFNESIEEEIEEVILALNNIINNHNTIVENFEAEVLNKKDVWECSYIASRIEELVKLEAKESKQNEEVRKVEEQISDISSKVTQLEIELSDNIKAEEALNEYLSQYLGRDDLQVCFNEQTKGFHFKRGEDDAANLSEGEKTGIALIYFLTKLGEKDFDISGCIVVIDDPVSSLDANSLFYAFSFVKEHCKKAKQLILLTHNFELLRQINKWFKHESRSDVSRFMIKCYQNEDGRFSIIDKLDDLLIRYESDYHYLFKLLYDKKESDQNSLSSVYNYPNITRRYLEMFFSFRAPGETKMHQKIEKAVQEGAITQVEGTALRHFLNVYSHGDNKESFTRFDVTHLANSKAAIESALKLVQKYDAEHYEAMVELVTQN